MLRRLASRSCLCCPPPATTNRSRFQIFSISCRDGTRQSTHPIDESPHRFVWVSMRRNNKQAIQRGLEQNYSWTCYSERKTSGESLQKPDQTGEENTNV